METMDFATNLPQLIFAIALGAARTLGFLAVFPLTSGEFVPATVRNGLAVVASMFIAPHLLETVKITDLNLMLLLIFGLKEVIVGALIGFSFGTLVWVFEALGALVEFQSGSSNSQVFDPLSGSETGLLSKFFVQFCLVLFLASGGLALIFRLLMESYVAWPVDRWIPNFPQITMQILKYISENFWLSFFQYSIAGIFCVYVIEIFFGISGKYAPQLNIFSLSLPIKSAMLLMVLVITLPGISSGFQVSFEGLFKLFNSILRPGS
jgi:type III secretion protein T